MEVDWREREREGFSTTVAFSLRLLFLTKLFLTFRQGLSGYYYEAGLGVVRWRYDVSLARQMYIHASV